MAKETLMMDDLLDSLEKNTRWTTAFQTFGNNHSTLVGLLVDWWIDNNIEHEAMEEAPSFAPRINGGGKKADAVFIEKGLSKGILEVEGTNYLSTIQKMGKYFNAPGWENLEFGVFLAYSSKASGGSIPPLPMDDFIKEGIKLTQQKGGKHLLVLTLDKKWDQQTSGPRARKNDDNGYYKGKPFKLTGAYIKSGTVVARRILKEL